MVHALIINKPHYLCIYRDLPYVQIDRHLSIYKNETQTVYIVRYTYIYIYTSPCHLCHGEIPNPDKPCTLLQGKSKITNNIDRLKFAFPRNGSHHFVPSPHPCRTRSANSDGDLCI